MTTENFKELRYIKKEIKMLQEEIKELHNTIKSPRFGVDSLKCGISNTVAVAAELLAEKEKLLNSALLRCMEKETEILKAIGEVPDSKMRQILKYKFIDGLNWVQTGHKLDASAESLKMAYKRWKEKCAEGTQQNSPLAGEIGRTEASAPTVQIEDFVEKS